MLVVFADSSGELKVLDGYCRHMGGNLAQGTVKGDDIACPFHDWRWRGDGRCSLVPYAKRTPRMARTRAWLTTEVNGQLLVWHDPQGSTPAPELTPPTIDGYADGRWSPWQWSSVLIEGSHCREIVDNNVDMRTSSTSTTPIPRTSRTSSRATQPVSTWNRSPGPTTSPTRKSSGREPICGLKPRTSGLRT